MKWYGAVKSARSHLKALTLRIYPTKMGFIVNKEFSGGLTKSVIRNNLNTTEMRTEAIGLQWWYSTCNFDDI